MEIKEEIDANFMFTEASIHFRNLNIVTLLIRYSLETHTQ